MSDTDTKTLGEQLNNVSESRALYKETQECGETAEMIWKHWLEKISGMVSKARKTHMFQKLWIVVHEFPVLPDIDNAVQVKMFLRDTEPTPAPGTYVFSHMPMSDQPSFEYCLPHEGLMEFILDHEKKQPGSHDPNTIKNITWFYADKKRRANEKEALRKHVLERRKPLCMQHEQK